MLDPFTRWLASGVGLTVGRDLYMGHRPDDAPVACSVVLERTGGRPYDAPSTTLEKPIQILTRGASYFGARDAAHRLYAYLMGKSGVAIAGWRLYSILGGTEPQFLGPGERGSFEFSANYIVRAKQEETPT